MLVAISQNVYRAVDLADTTSRFFQKAWAIGSEFCMSRNFPLSPGLMAVGLHFEDEHLFRCV